MIAAAIVSLGATLELYSFVSLEKYRKYTDYPVDVKPTLVQNIVSQDAPRTKEKLSFESAHKHTE